MRFSVFTVRIFFVTTLHTTHYRCKTIKYRICFVSCFCSLTVWNSYKVLKIFWWLSYTLVAVVCGSLPDVYVDKLLDFVASTLEKSNHLQFYLTWTLCVLTMHGQKLKNRSVTLPFSKWACSVVWFRFLYNFTVMNV